MDLDRLWKNTQDELAIVLAPQVYKTFVSPTHLIALQDHTATIACPYSYIAQQNHQRYHSFFKNALDRQTKSQNTLHFVVQPPVKSLEDLAPAGPLFSSPPSIQPSSHLYPHFTFANFIVGNTNNFAYAASQGIISHPGTTYNPFFIWGGVGVGKTHLMQAVGHELLLKNPSLKLRYFPAETFGNELVNALKTKNISRFKEKYRSLDCILVDDVQFIAGKEYIQEEFFHTFNALHLSGRQIILTSDRRPSNIDNLDDRLASRFLGGLTVDIQPPDYETRLAIIHQITRRLQIDLDPEAANLIAQNVTTNVRDLQGQLQAIIVRSQTQKISPINTDFVRHFFHPPSYIPLLKSDKLTSRHIIATCAKFFNVKTGDLVGHSRKKELTLARHYTAYLLLTEINLPLKTVGLLLGNRDHTSIMHARDKIQQLLSTNPPCQQLIHQLKQLL